MRLPALALLAVLLPATPGAADGLVVEPGSLAPGSTIAVSWRLPQGFEESELLIQVDGGPRVRLTDESREERPRVVVSIPALTGTARFLVRAGRREADGRHREHTIATSEPFALGPPVAGGPLPARALSSRPSAGEPMEWWSKSAGHAPEGPTPGLESRRTEWSPGRAETPAALPAPRPDGAPRKESTDRTAVDAGPAEPVPVGAGLRHGAFAGAPVPLRN